MRRTALVLGIVVATVAVMVPAWAATRPEGNAETERIARVVAAAVSYPRQRTADGWLAAVRNTRAGQDGRLTVVAAERHLDLGRGGEGARMTFHVHLDGTESGWITTEPVDACYDVDFGPYGARQDPGRTRCPDDLRPLTRVPGTPADLPPAAPPDNPFSPTN